MVVTAHLMSTTIPKNVQQAVAVRAAIERLGFATPLLVQTDYSPRAGATYQFIQWRAPTWILETPKVPVWSIEVNINHSVSQICAKGDMPKMEIDRPTLQGVYRGLAELNKKSAMYSSYFLCFSKRNEEWGLYLSEVPSGRIGAQCYVTIPMNGKTPQLSFGR